MSTREDSESTEFAEGVDSAPWEEVDMWLSLIVEYLGGGAMLISPSVSAKGKGEICQFLSCLLILVLLYFAKLISKCLFGFFKSTKKPMKFL